MPFPLLCLSCTALFLQALRLLPGPLRGLRLGQDCSLSLLQLLANLGELSLAAEDIIPHDLQTQKGVQRR